MFHSTCSVLVHSSRKLYLPRPLSTLLANAGDGNRVYRPVTLNVSRRHVTIHHSKGTKNGAGSETEKHLAELNLAVQSKYKEGSYEEALDLAKRAQVEMLEYFGCDHPVVASAWNNVAVMSKKIGRFDDAIEAYLQAVSTYRSSVGEKHPQYVTTLSNLGLCFQAAALQKDGEGRAVASMERAPLLERAVETFQEVVDLRSVSQVSYSDSGGTVSTLVKQAQMHLALATLYSTATGGAATTTTVAPKQEAAATEAGAEGRPELLSALTATEDYMCSLEAKLAESPTKSGGVFPELATALNNHGFVLKSAGRFTEAQASYEEALEMREHLFGPAHPDSVAAKHNLAECVLASGDSSRAAELQQQILDTLGVVVEEGDDRALPGSGRVGGEFDGGGTPGSRVHPPPVDLWDPSAAK